MCCSTWLLMWDMHAWSKFNCVGRVILWLKACWKGWGQADILLRFILLVALFLFCVRLCPERTLSAVQLVLLRFIDQDFCFSLIFLSFFREFLFHPRGNNLWPCYGVMKKT